MNLVMSNLWFEFQANVETNTERGQWIQEDNFDYCTCLNSSLISVLLMLVPHKEGLIYFKNFYGYSIISVGLWSIYSILYLR